jgi:hypothetical protein
LTKKLTYYEHQAFKEDTKGLLFCLKLQVINDVEKGLLTWKKIQVKYCIQGKSTVLVWLRKHGTLDWLSQIPMKKKAPPNPYLRTREKD